MFVNRRHKNGSRRIFIAPSGLVRMFPLVFTQSAHAPSTPKGSGCPAKHAGNFFEQACE
jgi:hypothetical protein